MDVKEKIRVIEGFPKEGISFKDITTLINDGESFKYVTDVLADHIKDKHVDLIAAPEARGFIFGAAIAYKLGVGFVPIRKKGKLPAETLSVSYGLEYGSDTLEVHKDAIKKGQKVAIVDDLLATGGTIEGVANLIEEMGGKVEAADFIIELTDLKGRERLKKYDVKSIVTYNV